MIAVTTCARRSPEVPGRTHPWAGEFRNPLSGRARPKIWTKEDVIMPKRILVPLKGTSASEAVLPIVAHATSGLGATLRLLHVAPVPHNLVSASGRVIAYADQVMG